MTVLGVINWMNAQPNLNEYFTTFAMFDEESVNLITQEMGIKPLKHDDKVKILKEFEENYNELALDLLWADLTRIIKNKLKEKKNENNGNFVK